MGLVSLLVYYKQADLLRINQWWEPIRLMHSTALGRLHAVHVSYLPFERKHSKEDIQLRMLYCTAIDGDWAAPEEAQTRVHRHRCMTFPPRAINNKKARGPGRELNPGPPPDDASPKKESYY
jgi:hypothetical protein